MAALQQIVLPTGLMALLFAAGLVALLLPRARACATLPLATAAALFLTFSNGLVATALMSPLEYAYPAMLSPERHPEAKAIVVLTAYAALDDTMPESSRLNSSSVFRVIEAANLSKRRPDCRIIVSGSELSASLMSAQLRGLGVSQDRIMIDGESPDTSDSAARVNVLAAGRPVFLVTSAGHMRRALGVFRKSGTPAIPAPTDYWLPHNPWNASWTQSSLHLQASDLAVHEYFALAWYRLTGRM
jgi:uncharacterized SAM-binding protein YcdF (DUF218 family)